ncbi:MAG: phenylacetate--CoA ligase family protein [Theionarchaea archaeon]|nr:phenylacetate--CoA ligase family protein [Theionarchaea archaeon]
MLPRMVVYGLKAYAIQWQSLSAVEKLQEKNLRHIVSHAYRNSPFYRQRFKEHGITPDDIGTINDLEKLPTVTKRDIIDNFSSVVSRGFSKETCTVESTSGSTGENMTILHDSRAIDYYAPVHIRGHMAVGLRPHHRTAYIRYKSMGPSLVERFGFFRFSHIPSDLPPSTIIERMKEIRAFAINCYPNTMNLIAKEISQDDAEFLSPHHIVTWSEKLTPRIRKTVEDTFHCPVYDQYGAFECHSIAAECTEKRMHINADVLVMEFLKEGEPVAPGERGEIVITNLWNRAMPFIRYKIGDIGGPSDEMCECGRGLPLMEELEGRTDDALVTTSGRPVLPSFIVPLFFPYPEIDAFQIVQKTRENIQIKIVKGKTYREETDRQIIQKFRSIFGNEPDIRIEHVEEIKKTPGGKLRCIICEVPQCY